MIAHYDELLKKQIKHSHAKGDITDYDTPYTGQQIVELIKDKVVYNSPVTLSISSGSVAVDGSLGNLFRLTLTEDCTIQNPTNIVAGAVYQIEINQDDSGLWVVSWGTNFRFPNGEKPIISLDGNAIDIITFYAKSASILLVTYVQNFA